MRIRFVKEKAVKLSPISAKTYPAGWAGEVEDAIAVEAILDETAVDPAGEMTKAVLEAEIARRQAIIEAGGDPDAPVVEEIDLAKATLAELREYASEIGVDHTGLTKAKLLAAIEEHLEAPKGSEIESQV